MKDKKNPIGKVIHYYDKIGVAVIELLASIKFGDLIKIIGKDNEFTQTVNSMQIEHEQIKIAKKGQIIGLKVDQPVKENYLVYKA